MISRSSEHVLMAVAISVQRVTFISEEVAEISVWFPLMIIPPLNHINSLNNSNNVGKLYTLFLLVAMDSTTKSI